MCGLVGYFGSTGIGAERTFLDMLRVDVVRGTDSTGVALLSECQKPKLIKGPFLPDDLFDTKEFVSAISSMYCGYLGHNRYRTQGAVNAKNAHPFWRGKIIGAHNGTIMDRGCLPNKDKFEVDSEQLIDAIDKMGIEKVWSELNGAAAITWFNLGEKNLNFIRNSQRPLCFGYTKNKDGVFWASEHWMIHACAARNKVDIAENDVFELPVDELFSFRKGKEGNKDVLFLTQKKLEPKTWRSHRHTSNHGQMWDEDMGFGWQQQYQDPNITHVRNIVDEDLAKRREENQRKWNEGLKEREERIAKEKEARAAEQKELMEQAKQAIGVAIGTPVEEPSPPPLAKDVKLRVAYADPTTASGTLRKSPVGGLEYNFFPMEIQKQTLKDFKVIYKIICGFQQWPDKEAVLTIEDENDPFLLYLPTTIKGATPETPILNKVFLKAKVQAYAWRNSLYGASGLEFKIQRPTVTVIIPKDAKRIIPGRGLLLKEHEFHDKYKAGCAWCDDALEFDDFEIVFHNEKDMAICGSCAGAAESGKLGPNINEIFRIQEATR